MENPCSDPARGSSISRGCGESSAAADGKGMCTEAASGSKQQKTNGRDVDGVETTFAWTGEKKAKIQIIPISSDPGKTEEDDSEQSDKIVHATNQEQQEPEQIEGFDWDDTMLKNEMDRFFNHYTGLPDGDDDEFWVPCEEKQLAELNLRLALYRLRAHEISKGTEVKDLDEKELRMYPLSTLIKMGYLYRFESKFEWYFDHEYCQYAKLEDYQRLVLRDNGQYMDWEHYQRTCSSLQSDQEFVQFWEKLSSKTKWIENFLDAGLQEWKKMQRVAFYHCVKIAAEFPNIYSNLFYSVLTEYMWSVRFDNSVYKNHADLYLEIWKLVAKQKMSVKEAVERLKDKAMQAFCLLELEAELKSDERRPGPMTCHYKTYMAHIDEKVSEDEANRFIKEAVKEFVPKQKIYYDYAKRKLGIAEKIGLQPAHKCHSIQGIVLEGTTK